ncbi:hypothetical protein V3C33_05335 [Micrococcaceae bacterium Sec5.7]
MSLGNSDCGRTVDELLLDAGHSDAPELRAALMSLGSLANLPAPAPSAELAALMAGPHTDLTRQRWLRKHRPAVVGIAVLTGMGLGVSGVAASGPQSPTSDVRVSIQDLAQDWTPGWTIPAALPPAADPAEQSAAAAAPAGRVRTPAAQAAKPSSGSPGRQAQGNDRQAKDLKTPAAASSRGKAKKNDAGAAAASAVRAAAIAEALEAAARERSSAQRLRIESSRLGVGVKQLLKNASRLSAVGNRSVGRHTADPGTSWLQKFRH